LEKINLVAVGHSRTDQKSFHIASERHVRIEFVRLFQGEEYGPLLYRGDLIVTAIEGDALCSNISLCPMDQAVIPEGEKIHIVCNSKVFVFQLIWAPSFSETSQFVDD
jgi:hypothetical protein